MVLVDTYERLAPLDDWVRTGLLPRLPATALTVTAGRMPPGAAWRADPELERYSFQAAASTAPSR